MAQMGAGQPEKPLAVPHAFEELKARAGVLAGLIDRLEVRLLPVLAPAVPSPSVGGIRPSDESGPYDPSSLRLTDHLVELQRDLTIMGSRIEHLLNGLEI